MKKFLKNQRVFIALASFFLMIGVSGYFVVVPLLKKITERRDEIEENRLKQEIKKQRLEELPRLAKQYTEISNQQKKLDVLLERQQAVVLIERLEELAKNTENEIQIVVQEDAQSKKAVESKSKNAPKVLALVDTLPSKDFLRLKITLTGNYAGAFKFIYSLEALEYYADVVEISIGQAKGKEQASFSASVVPEASNPFKTQAVESPQTVVLATNQLETTLTVVFYSKN